LDSLKSNMQMSALLPLLMNQQLTITQDLQFGSSVPITANGSAISPMSIGDSLTFAQSDMMLALLPALMMGGDSGGNGGGGFGGSNMAMIVLAIALSQPTGSGSSSNNLMLPLLLMAMMGQNQSSDSDSNSD
jgi:hypothetical protein